MIQVTKDEAAIVRKTFPEVRVTIVNRNSNHKRYYVPEESRVMRLIEGVRGK